MEAIDLQKKFGSKTALDGLSLQIRPGQILGLLGPNGAGKSTAINILSGQTTPDRGRIKLDGAEYAAVPGRLRGQIGVMPQDVILWDDLNILENLKFTAVLQNLPAEQTRKRIQHLIEGLSLQPELKTLAKNLSGGYKRRLNLAISIIHDPSLVFLDEPSPGIDPQSRRFLWDFIRSLKTRDRAVVLTDHYLEEAEKLADYVVIMDHGGVIASGSVPELKRRYGDGTLLSLRFKNPPPDKLAALALTLDRAKTTPEGLSLIAKRGINQLEKILSILPEYGLEIQDIEIKEPSLEDIFLILTGKEIRE